MSTRIFSIALVSAAVFVLPVTAAVRPEIAQHLIIAGFSPPVYAEKEIRAAEAVPNQTAEEKRAVARVKYEFARNPGLTPCGTGCGGISDDKFGIQEPPPDHPPENMSPSH